MKLRLDVELVRRGLVASRSQAEQEIEFGNVTVDGRIMKKTSFLVDDHTKLRLIKKNPYVSRAGLKLESVAAKLKLDFKGRLVLDVGSSTGGFSDYALQHGAKHVVAVDVGTEQLHPKLRLDPRIELHEQTDIRSFDGSGRKFDIVVADVSFISLREILPAVLKLATPSTQIVAMCKPQFEAGANQTNKGVVKNSRLRSDILQAFEKWLTANGFVIRAKADSSVAGEKGNLERFYLLSLAKS